MSHISAGRYAADSAERKLRLANEALPIQAAAELRRSSYPPLHRISCEYTNGALRLSGRLPSFYLKQLAQTLVARQLNGTRIDNRVEVKAG